MLSCARGISSSRLREVTEDRLGTDFSVSLVVQRRQPLHSSSWFQCLPRLLRGKKKPVIFPDPVLLSQYRPVDQLTLSPVFCLLGVTRGGQAAGCHTGWDSTVAWEDLGSGPTYVPPGKLLAPCAWVVSVRCEWLPSFWSLHEEPVQ